MTQIKVSNEEKKTRKPKKSVKAYSRKATSMTFWNELRIKKNYGLKELSEVLEVSIGNLSQFFTGKVMPSRVFSDKVSQLFGVDEIEGWHQFQSGYEVYHNTHGKSITVKPVKVNPVIEDKVNKYVNEPIETVVVEEIHQTETPKFRSADRSYDKLLMAIAASMKIEDFIELIHAIDEGSVKWSEVLDQLYGKIDVKTFIQLVRLKNN